MYIKEEKKDNYDNEINEKFGIFNAMIKEHSSSSSIIFLPLLTPPPINNKSEKLCNIYLKEIEILTNNLPPSCLVLASTQKDIDSDQYFPSVVAMDV